MCCCDRKKRDACLSAASCASLPIAATQRQAPRRGDALRSPFFAYFLWRDKESERLPGRPRQRTIVRRKQSSPINHASQAAQCEASCASLPIAATQHQAPRRSDALRSPFFAYFLWRDKESERLPGRPRQRTPVRRKQTSSNNRTRYQQTAQPENQAWCATSQEYVCARHTRHTYRALSVHTRSARPPTDRKRYKVPQHKQANAQCQRRPVPHATTPSLRWR